MFFKYLEPLIKPFRTAQNKIVKAKNVKGNIKMDVKRVGRYGQNAQNMAKGAQGKVNAATGHAKQAGAQAQQVQGQVAGGAPPMPGAPGAPPAPGAPQGAINPNPEVKKVGLFGRKKVCTQCGQQLDKSWDACPYCAQAAAGAQAAPAAQKTMAFMIDHGGGGQTMQMLGWLVPLKGPQRGELYTLAPVSLVGTDMTCTVCLHDQFMSSSHAEIKAEGGVWILRDLGSTNGTFVNDKRIDKHELVDNDFVKFGQSLVKFKSL